ncbi:ATP-dependent DNA helicase RecG [Bacteroidota bacterium]
MNEKSKENVSELQFIKGVGPVKAKALAEDGINTYSELINYFPRDYIDRDLAANLRALSVKLKQEDFYSIGSDISSINFKNEITVIAGIIEKRERKFGKNRKMLELVLSDDTGKASIIFWSYTEYYSKTYKIGDRLVISGRAELDKYGKISFNHPEIERFDEEDEKLYRAGGILPIYKMTQAMKSARWTMRTLRQVMTNVLEKELSKIGETLPDYILKEFKFPDKKKSVKNLHFPDSHNSIISARNRMKFEEIFYFELFLAIRHRGTKVNENGTVMNPKSPRARELFDSLPFKLTKDQKKVIREITDDMKSGSPMNRLLQGDVGSGKTIVSILTMLVAIDNGCQTALMAPTEILAEQHYHTLMQYFADTDLNVVQLLGGQRVKIRRKILEEISSGKANIIVGTHAMFESDIAYNKLGLVVIDEQHRFGVAQRARLKTLAEASFGDENVSPHILVMSATPIPRTLSLTLYGDLDVSIIKEKPKNRKPIKTEVVFESRLADVYKFIMEQAKKGFQSYIVYPLVEKSEKLELKAATEQYEKIKNEIFPDLRCGLLHGQMFWYEKEDAMKAFLNKEYDVLIATTVIEVGIDISNVTVMLIENADRFGLSQLHQLRGRVGRGAEQSYCFLGTKDNYMYALRRNSDNEYERKSVIVRLKTMEETNDGFKISEVDLKLRGPGDVLGTRQSGLPAFKFVDLVNDGEIISKAKRTAFSIIEKDSHLRKPENKVIRKEYKKLYSENDIYFDIA